MSVEITQSYVLAAAAEQLRAINAAQRSGNAVPANELASAAADVVAMVTSGQITAHAELYRTISAQAAAVQNLLAIMLGTSVDPGRS